MELDEFSNKLKDAGRKINIDISDKESKSFFDFMNLLIEWNEKMNLTAITEPNDVILKHFIDSITIDKHINRNSSVIDVGTGAGFPGIPLSIVRNDLKITLMDSLNKRINFLNEVIKDINLENVNTIHSRAEELGRDKNFREKFDVATSRAVAPLNVLLEYMLPFIKVGGCCICMKGANVDEEIENSKNALKVLNGKIEKIEKFELPEIDNVRNIIIIRKTGNIPGKYPRKPGTPSKEPLK